MSKSGAAGESVNVKSEFTSKLNSELHIYTDDTFNECGEYSDFHHARFSHKNPNDLNNSFQLELSFKIQDTEKLFVSPNPTSGIINVSINIEKEITDKVLYIILDINGKILFQNNLDNKINKIDLSSFSKGVYSLTVKCNSFIFTKKIVIQ